MAANSLIILVTGTSSGFGLLTAARLAAKGHQVIATMRDLKKRGALDDEMNRRGAQVEVLRLDVTDRDSIRDAVRQIGARHGKIDVLVNNAGYGLGGFFEDLTEKEIREQMETNFFGVQNVTREVIPFMRQQKSGKIINISSVSGFQGSPAFGAYNASKWALEGFSESLRHELKYFGIDVCCIEPGTYKTKIFYENAHYARNFDNADSPYYERSQFLKKRVMSFVDDLHKDSEDVAELVEKLINASNPPLRNIPDIESQVMYGLRKLLPLSWYMALLGRGLWKGYKASR